MPHHRESQCDVVRRLYNATYKPKFQKTFVNQKFFFELLKDLLLCVNIKLNYSLANPIFTNYKKAVSTTKLARLEKKNIFSKF